jgi:uncharacterized RDD family membrane protein YckC
VSTAAPLSLALPIETPENVVLTHQLAGPAWRCAAYLIDFAFRWAVMMGAMFVASIAAIALPGLAIGSLLLLLFLLEWGYYIGFEYFWQGQTPGKRLLGLRVIHENGQPLSWWGATLRNLVRAADTLPLMLVFGEQLGPLALVPVYGPALICMTLCPKLQRLGDLAARTVVIHERRTKLPRDPVIYDHIQPLAPEDINSFVPRSDTLALIDQYLGRRSVLTYRRGHDLAAELAQVLARKLDYRGDAEAVKQYPMAFLARVYVTFAVRREEEPQKSRARSKRSSRPQRERV